MKVTLRFIEDPGHGWLEAPADMVRSRGLEPSGFSYYDWKGDMIYLEEDCDAALLVNALKEEGIELTIEHMYQDPTFVRDLPHWGTS